MDKDPRLLLIPDEDFGYGIQHGAYPEYKDDFQSGDALVLSRKDATSIYGIPDPQENKIYLKNIYNGTFGELTSPTIETDLLAAKSVCIREVLIMLGAYSASLNDSVQDTKEDDLTASLKYKGSKLKSAEAQYHQNKKLIVSIKSNISVNPYPRKAKDPAEIRQYMNTHGLGNESTLIAWVDRLERDKKLEGAESIDVTFLRELDIARDAALKLKLVQNEVGFGLKSLSSEKHEFTRKINVDFGGSGD